MADVLSNYRTGEAFDEMMDAEGSVRPSYQAVYSALSRSTADDLRMIAESLANNYTQAGVTFDVGGVERPFPLDLVPRVIASPEWEIIEAGVAQRVRALEAFLADIYADARVITDGVIPEPADYLLHPFPSSGLGHQACQWRAHSRRRYRPDPQSSRRCTRAGG